MANTNYDRIDAGPSPRYYGPKEYNTVLSISPMEGEPTPPAPLPAKSLSYLQPRFVVLAARCKLLGGVRSSHEILLQCTSTTVEMLLFVSGSSGFIATQLAWHRGRYMSQALLEATVVVAGQEGRPFEPSGCRSNVP